MCVDDDSRPPIHPLAGGLAGSSELRLASADGTRFMAHASRAAAPAGVGVVVIPDVRGLHQYYKDLADRFAEVGVDAVAIDVFARTAPSDDRSDGFDFMAHLQQTKPATLQADIAAAAAHLRGQEGGQVGALFAVGFCFGGSLSYFQAASGLGYAGVIAFYGWPLGFPWLPERPRPIDAVGRFTCPVLSLFGGADEWIPPGAGNELDAACRKAGVEHELAVYPGAPHSFFDKKQTEFAEASADAWQRVQAFVRSESSATR